MIGYSDFEEIPMQDGPLDLISPLVYLYLNMELKGEWPILEYSHGFAFALCQAQSAHPLLA